MKTIQLTLAIIKPHICKNPILLQEIHNLILKNKFLFIKSKLIQMNQSQAQLFYKEHEGKFFYDRLVSMMSSGESWIHILARYDAIKKWRELMGPTKVSKTRIDQPETIRGQFGFTDTRNACHGSDSPETAKQEIEFFFPKFSIDEWYTQEEPRWKEIFLLNTKIQKENSNIKKIKVDLDRNKWQHAIIDCQ